MMSLRRSALISATGAILIALVVVIIANLIRSPNPGAASPSAAPPSVTTQSAEPAPTYNQSAGDAGEDDNAPAESQDAIWGPVADRFATNFTDTRGGHDQWHRRLIGNPASSDVTTEVAAQLKTIDIRNVPTGHYVGRQLLKSSAYEVAVKVSYREDWAMVLYLITDGTHWQIYAYDRWQP